MPLGSEGSLKYQVIVNPKQSNMAAYVVVIYGDLRDYGVGQLNEIKEWFKKVLKECGMIRQATLEIDCEDSDTIYILSYDNNNSDIDKVVLKEISYKKEG